MPTTESTTSYIELTTQTGKLLLDAASNTQKRALDHAKNHVEILARPYVGISPDAYIREGFDRANQIGTITATELQTTLQKNAELLEKLLVHASKVQESVLHSLHGLSSTGLSNLNYVKETANAQLDTFAKRVEEVQDIQKRATATAGAAGKG